MRAAAPTKVRCTATAEVGTPTATAVTSASATTSAFSWTGVTGAGENGR